MQAEREDQEQDLDSTDSDHDYSEEDIDDEAQRHTQKTGNTNGRDDSQLSTCKSKVPGKKTTYPNPAFRKPSAAGNGVKVSRNIIDMDITSMTLTLQTPSSKAVKQTGAQKTPTDKHQEEIRREAKELLANPTPSLPTKRVRSQVPTQEDSFTDETEKNDISSDEESIKLFTPDKEPETFSDASL